ncbi:hypothetical protein M885DRAFT_543858 [Pelagophyceae sp. CCMP2097]|nr:hypothetical protein M885DRAFT_543858 [Pelagophyceae sp. CCMP2097]
MASFSNLRLFGHPSTGTLSVGESELSWTPRGSQSGAAARATIKSVVSAHWTLFGKYAAVAFLDKAQDVLLRVDGFSKRERETVAAELLRVGITLEARDFASSGANRGHAGFEGSRLVVTQTAGGEDDTAESKRLFDLDLRDVTQCIIPAGVGAKAADPREVTMQFVEHDTGDEHEHQLVELRLYVPPGALSAGGDDEDDEAVEGSTAAQKLQAAIVRKSKLQQGDTAGAVLVSFAADDGTFLLPRGRYGIEMYASFFRMHGSVYDYKIRYEDVERFILLPKTDDVHYVFIICLDKPIRQGQQRYQHLVWQTGRGNTALELNLTDEEITARYGDASGLKPSLDGPLYQLVARAFKVLSAKKVFTTGKFRSFDDRHAITCSLKAKTGQLYPLERSFVFIHQPTMSLKFEDVASVEFERFSGYGEGTATRNFDLRVQMKASGGEAAREHTFTSIERAEYKPLLDFLSSKALKIRNLDQTKAAREKDLKQALGDDGGDDDDDDDAVDHYKAQLKKGKGDEEEGAEDEESVDEDFDPTEKKAGSDGGDDEEDDDDSGPDGSDAGSDDEAPKKNSKKPEKNAVKKAPPAKKEKKRSRDDDDESEEEEEEEEEKPKKKAAAKKPAAKKRARGSDDDEPSGKKGKPVKKKKKDPNAPKGPKSSYILFSMAKRPEVLAEDSSLGMGDISKKIGAMWKELSEDKKNPYIDAAKKEKDAYAIVLKAYKAKLKAEGNDDDDEPDEDED